MKRTKKLMTLLALLLVFSLSLVACGGGAKGPLESVVKSYFEAVSAGDFDKISEFIDGSEGSAMPATDVEGLKAVLGEENLDALFKAVGDVKIIDPVESIEGDKGTLKAKFEGKTLKSIIENYMNATMEYSTSPEAINMDLEALNAKMLDIFSDTVAKTEKTTTEGEIQFVKVGDTWKLAKENPFLEKMLSGE